MASLRQLNARLLGAAVAVLPRDWIRTMIDLDAKISEAADRLAVAEKQRRPLALEALEGNAEAHHHLTKIDSEISSLERTLRDLRSAREGAADRAAAKDAAETERMERERLDRVRGYADALHDGATAAQTAVDDLVVALKALNAASDGLLGGIHRSEATGTLALTRAGISAYLAERLATAGFGRRTGMIDGPRGVVDLLPTRDYLVGTARLGRD